MKVFADAADRRMHKWKYTVHLKSSWNFHAVNVVFKSSTVKVNKLWSAKRVKILKWFFPHLTVFVADKISIMLYAYKEIYSDFGYCNSSKYLRLNFHSGCGWVLLFSGIMCVF